MLLPVTSVLDTVSAAEVPGQVESKLLMSLPPPVLRAPGDAAGLRRIFADAGYSAETLRSRLATRNLQPAAADVRSALAVLTNQPTPFHALARWFLVGQPVARRVADAAFASDTLELLHRCGLIAVESEEIIPTATITPFEQFLVASDTRAALTSGVDADAVLFPSPTTEVLSRFAVRRPDSTVLELGTGCGAVALVLAGEGRRILATDVTARAAAFATFNVQWNGAEAIEILQGDRFQPVRGRRFDLIVSNPPFFVSPPSDFVACRNPFELDEFCRSLVRDAPAHLNDGGMLQILLEWVELEGQPWQDRIHAWVDDLGCDVWLAKGYTKTPAEYAERRLRESTADGELNPDMLTHWTDYLRARNVVQVHGGVLAMRKRDAQNWTEFLDDVDGFGTEPFGDSVLASFRALDALHSAGNAEALLDATPRLSSHARLNVQYSPGAGNWTPVSLRLRLIEGAQQEVALDSTVASFLAGFDGSHTVRELLESFAATMNAPAEQVRPQCLTLVAKLMQKGLIVV